MKTIKKKIAKRTRETYGPWEMHGPADGRTYAHRMDALVLYRNPTRWEGVTEDNAENIQPIEGALTNVNPLHERRTSAHVRDLQQGAPSYRKALQAFAFYLAEKHVRRSKRECGHLLHEFAIEAESEANAWLGERMRKFPKAADLLLYSFISGSLPPLLLRSLHTACHRACDRRHSRMTGSTVLVETQFFDVFAQGEPDQSEVLNRLFVVQHFAYLRSEVEKQCTNGNRARAARNHFDFLAQAERYFLASINGDPAELGQSGFVGGHLGTLTYGSLYKRLQRLGAFIGRTF